MKISLICYKAKTKKGITKSKVKTVRSSPATGGRNKYKNLSYEYNAGRGVRAKAPGNNLQLLYKRKSIINQKLRVRKFKSRVTMATPIRWSPANGLKKPRVGGFFSLRLTRAMRITYATLIGMEKTFMRSKGTAKIYYRKYPDFFITKKSSKSRMGKGKGKISGRILKLRRGESIVDLKFRNYFKSEKYIKALRRAIPSTTRLTWRSRWARRMIYNAKRYRPWKAYKKRVRKKQWQINLERAGLLKNRRHYLPQMPDEQFQGQGSSYHQFIAWKLQPRLIELNKVRSKDRKLMLRPFRRWRMYSVSRPFYRTVRVRNRRRLHRYAQFFSRNTIRMTPLSGGSARNFKQKWVVGFWGLKKFYEQQFLPDEDGYYGMFKMANWYMRKKRANAALFHHRSVSESAV